MATRMQKIYETVVRPEMTEQFKYENVMKTPRLEKVVINMGVGEAAQDSKKIRGALADLEALVESMESGDMSLEESLHAFERGVKLTRHCQAALKSAELKVKILTENDELVSLDLDSQADE